MNTEKIKFVLEVQDLQAFTANASESMSSVLVTCSQAYMKVADSDEE